MKKTLTPHISAFLFYIFFIHINLAQCQDLCPPLFVEGQPLNGEVYLYWDEPDSLSGYGDEIFSACFPICESATEGFLIEHLGQDTSGGWFQDKDGEFDCGTDMYTCADGGSDHFSAFAAWSDTLAPVNSRMRTGLIDLSSYTNVTLFFDEYIEFSEDANDANWVEVSTDSIDWEPVYYSDPMDLGDGFVINLVDLSDYSGQTIYLGFRFYDSVGYNENWYVDNIRIFGNDGASYENPCGQLSGYNILQDGINVGFSETNEFTVDGLSNNVDYCFSVKAVYGLDESEPSSEACYTPVFTFEITQTFFRDTLDYLSSEYSIFQFSLINHDIVNHDFNFSSDEIIQPTEENILLSDDFNTGTSENLFDINESWKIGTVESANTEFMVFPDNTDGEFFFINDDNEDYYYSSIATNAMLQSQAYSYDGSDPIFLFLDMYFPNPGGSCSTENWYSDNASILVSADSGATWITIDSTFATSLGGYNDYYSYYVPDFNFGDANWHTLMYNITPYLIEGSYNIGINYNDCGGAWAYGIGIDNLFIVQGDSTHWLSFERLSGKIVAGDIMSMSLTMVPRHNQNQYEEADLFLDGATISQLLEIVMITDPDNVEIDYLIVQDKFSLNQNYPNPFNPVTTISYNLQKDALVSINIYDMSGRHINTLISSFQSAGYNSITWDPRNNKGETVSAGIYLLTIDAGSFRQTKKMVYLK